jgi:hypothetical protein
MAGLLQRERVTCVCGGKERWQGCSSELQRREGGRGRQREGGRGAVPASCRGLEAMRGCPSFSPVFYFCFSTYVVSPLVYPNLFETKRLVCCSLFVIFTKGQLSAHSSRRVQKGLCSTDTDTCIGIRWIRICVSVSGGYDTAIRHFIEKLDTWIRFNIFSKK